MTLPVCLRWAVARVYTPKDFELNVIMGDIVTLADPRSGGGGIGCLHFNIILIFSQLV